MEIGGYKECSVSRNSDVFIKGFFGKITNSRLYVLVVNNYIEIRTEQQHRNLLEFLRRRSLETNNADDKKRYNLVLYYSRPVSLIGKGRISLGSELVNSRQLMGTVIVEKCSNCVRIWHPRLFNEVKNNSKVYKLRR